LDNWVGALIIVLVIVGGLGVYSITRPAPAPVEIADLTIGDFGGQGARATDGSYTKIAFGLKHNDGLNHTVTVIFELTAEGSHYVSITTAVGGNPLPRSGNSFRYNRPIYAADSYLPQTVFAYAQLSGVRAVTVDIKISLLVDNEPVGETKTVSLDIS
jgi:hypothetical protein